VTVSKDSMKEIPPCSPVNKSWLVNSEIRLLTSGDEILIRQGSLVRRCVSRNVFNIVTALLNKAENGKIDLDTSVVDTTRRSWLDRVCKQLADAGLLIELTEAERGEELDPMTFGLWQRAGGTIDRIEIAKRLRTSQVNIVGSGSLVDRLRTCCHQVGLQVKSSDDDADNRPSVAVVVAGYEEDPALEEWNERALAAGSAHPWLALIPFDGEHATVGPWMVPGESACYRCYRLRRASVFPDESVSATLARAKAVDLGLDQSSRYPGLNLIQIGLVVDRLIEHIGLEGQAQQSLSGGLTTVAIGPRGIEIERHRVLRVPRCPQCSPGSGRGYPQVWFSRSAATSASSSSPNWKVQG
jgi:bacteriocin biosynthesis cyclodehydratase domain-containing protein